MKMYLYTMIAIMALLNVVFMTFQNPINMGFLLMIQNTMVSCILLFFYESSWFSLLIFIMFIGGTLIVLIYIISLINNIPMDSKNNIFAMFMMIFFLISIYYMDFSFNMNMKEIMLMTEMKSLKFLFLMFSKSYYKITIFLVVYLFLTMLVVMKIINTKKNMFKF